MGCLRYLLSSGCEPQFGVSWKRGVPAIVEGTPLADSCSGHWTNNCGQRLRRAGPEPILGFHQLDDL